MDAKTIIYGVLFLFLLYILFAHNPGGGGHDHDKKNDRDGKRPDRK